MPASEENKLIIKIDKNLQVLISRFDQEIKSNDEFKAEIKSTIDNTQTRLRDIEIWKSKTEVKQEDEQFIRRSVIKWVVGNILTTALSVVGVIYLLTSKGF